MFILLNINFAVPVHDNFQFGRADGSFFFEKPRILLTRGETKVSLCRDMTYSRFGAFDISGFPDKYTEFHKYKCSKESIIKSMNVDRPYQSEM